MLVSCLMVGRRQIRHSYLQTKTTLSDCCQIIVRYWLTPSRSVVLNSRRMLPYRVAGDAVDLDCIRFIE